MKKGKKKLSITCRSSILCFEIQRLLIDVKIIGKEYVDLTSVLFSSPILINSKASPARTNVKHNGYYDCCCLDVLTFDKAAKNKSKNCLLTAKSVDV